MAWRMTKALLLLPGVVLDIIPGAILLLTGNRRFPSPPTKTTAPTRGIALLLAEAVLFRSWRVLTWLAIFFLGNAAFFPLAEEPGLERRFGSSYRAYRANVPRWLPRLEPWNGHDQDL